MSKGLKVWLWVIFVINILSAVSMLVLVAMNPLYIVSIIAEILLIAGICMLLFCQKKLGFYLLCAGAVVAFILNLVLGLGILRALVGLIVTPLVTYLLMKNDWDTFK